MNTRFGLIVTLAAMLGGAAAGQDRAPAPDAQPDGSDAARRTRQRAVEVIVTLAEDRNPVFRANAIEAMQPMPDRALPLAQRGLADHSPVVRYAAVVTAGMLEFKSLAPAIRPLVDDPDPSVRAAALYALHTFGEPVDITPLAEYLVSADPPVRGNAAMLLGLIGEPSAAPMLKQAANAPMPRAAAAQAAVVRCQFAEAVVRLGDDSELDTLRASAYNTVGEVRVIAINALGAVADERMAPALARFLNDEPHPESVEVQIAAAGALARLGKPMGLRKALEHSRHASPIVRSQAAWALGWFGDPASFARLAEMVDDQTPIIRVAASASILRRTADLPPPGPPAGRSG
jgi:HEAT repeat protein